MFEVVGQDIISGMGFIGTDPDRLYRMGATEKTEDVTVTGNPAVLDNATGKPFRGLHIYGRSEQVTTTGAQLLDASLFKNTSSASVECNGSDIIITALEDGVYRQTSSVPIGFFKEGDQICLAAEAFPEDNVAIIRDSSDATIANVLISNGLQEAVTIPANGTYYIILCINKGVSVKAGTVGVFSKLIVNKGNVSKDYEPYTGGKPSPSPEYPQEIVSAGGDGSLNVTVRGKNIFPGPEQPKTVEKNGLTFSYKDGMYTLVGTSNTDTWFNIYPNIRNSTSVTDIGGTIRSIGKVAVVNGLKNELCKISFRDANIKDKTENVTSSNNKKHLSFDTNGAFIHARPGTYSETFMLMIVDENQTEDYEPYHEPQSMSVTTPNGLPGIPVTSGGNYTDENGQQWICDEVDFGREMYVQRVKKSVIGDVTWRMTNANKHEFATEALHNIANKTYRYANGLCDMYNVVLSMLERFTNKSVIFGIDGYQLFVCDSDFNTVNEAKTYFAEHPLTIMYVLATPIETPLTASEIAAYKSLRTYKGTTIVEAEDKAGISVTYRRSAKTDNTSAERKIEESEKKEYDES